MEGDDEHVETSIMNAMAVAKNAKPNDHTEKDRYYAILITDLEKILAFVREYIHPRQNG